MVAKKGQAIGLGVISILVIGSGIAVMVLSHALVVAMEGTRYRLTLSAFWMYGLPILLIGGLGILAAALRNNIIVGIYMGFCILCLVVQGVFVVFIFIALTLFSGLCIDSCDEKITSIVNQTRALCAVIIIAWLLMLAGSIASCTACCCGEPQTASGHAGVIIVPGGAAPGYELNQPAQGYPQGHPQGYGQGYAAPYPVKDSENRY